MSRNQIKQQAALYTKFVEWSDSGRFVHRVEPALHRRLAAKALAAGESLNSYCARTLCKA